MPEFPGYEVERLVGRGGMGRVYCARDRRLGRRVAVKCLLDDGSDGTSQRFADEAKTVAALRHPNIAQLHEFRADHDPPFLVMEFVAGGTLAGFLADRVLAARPAAQIAAALARAVAYAHRNRIVHRDLKPGNILLESADDADPAAARNDFDTTRLKVADFGLAKQLNLGSGLTQSGEIVGTAAYMSPEQAMGVVSQIGPTTDVYALGAILYEMLTGRPPFTAPEAVQTLMMLLSDDVVAPRNLVKSVPRDLQTICLKCLEKKPSQRYATADALADDLDRFLRGEPIAARPISRLQKGIKWAKRRPWQATALATIGLSLVGASVGLVVLRRAYAETQTANDELVRVNNSLVDADRRTREAVALTREALDRIVDRVRNELYDVPGAGALTDRTVADSVELRRKLVALRPDSVEAVRELVGALDIQRLTYWHHGERKQSETVGEQLKQLVAQAAARFPDDIYLATERVKLDLESIDELEAATRPEVEARAAAEIARLLAANPVDPLVRRAASLLERRRTDAAVAAGDIAAVVEHADKRVTHAEAYLRLAPEADRTAARMWLISARLSLADYQTAAQDAAGMKDTLERTRADVEALDRKSVSEAEYRGISARVHELGGKAARFDGDLARAAQSFQSAAEELAWQRERFPKTTSTLTALAQVQLLLAETLLADRKPAEAAERLKQSENSADEALRIVPDDYLAGALKRRIDKVRASMDPTP
jgi:serine/threonine-protein kinase